MTPAIEIRDLTKSYGSLKALNGVSMTVETGEIFGLIGPDGAGKSTLYRILATLLKPESGSAKVLGLDTVGDYRTLRRRIGYMPERFSLYPDMTVMENLHFFADLFGVGIKDNYDIIAPVFSQLKRFPDRRAGALSGGMKQKLALSCALIHRPELLLLDEPTTGVDAVSRSEFWDMLATLPARGITILVSTSYMDEATRCGRIAVIDKGKILDTGAPQDLTTPLNGKIYNAEASDMYRLLEALRDIPETSDCYTFGANLHILGESNLDLRAIEERLRSAGINDARLYPGTESIEDLFIKLTQNDD